MKKLTVYLLCLLLVGALAGCTQAQVTTGEQPSTVEPTTSTSTGATETTVPTTTAVEEPEDTLSEALIARLTEYIKDIYTCYDMGDYNIGLVIRWAQKGSNAYFVITDNDSYYYACAYCDSDHNELWEDYDCVDSYIWVRFDSEAEITETYNGATLAIAFQVNRVKQCRNLKTDGSTVFGFCQKYTPEFADGLNTASALACDKMFITTWGSGPIYLVYNWTPDWYCTLPCAEVDEQFYFCQHVGQRHSDGTISYYQYLDYDFGDYYDALMEAMSSIPQQEMGSYGMIYGLINIEDIARIIRSEN